VKARVRWLLPPVLRRAVVVVDVACAGLVALAWAGGSLGPGPWTTAATVAGVATVLAFLPARRELPTIRSVAAVVAISPPPADDAIGGPCAMTLRIDTLNGRTHQFVHTEPYVRRSTWPLVGSQLVVDIRDGRRPSVAIRWDLSRVERIVSTPVALGAEPGRLTLDELFGGSELDAAAEPRGADPEDQSPLAHPVFAIPAAREPSDLVRRYLLPTERFRGEWRRHWIRPARELALGLALALLLQSGWHGQVRGLNIDLSKIPDERLLAQGFWVLWVAWRAAAWSRNRLVLTNSRVLLVSGLVGRRIRSVPIAVAGDHRLTQTLLGRLLGYGTLRFGRWPAPGASSFGDLQHPADVYLSVAEETFQPEAAEARSRPARIDDGL
jgi:hypothetical protein